MARGAFIGRDATPLMRPLLKHRLLTKEESDALVEQARAGDAKARERLLLHGMRMLGKQASDTLRTYYCGSLEWSELVAVGICGSGEGTADGFDHALAKYDATKGADIFSYWRWWARSAMRKAILTAATVRLPMKSCNARNYLWHRDTDGKRMFMSLDDPVPGTDDLSLIDTLAAPDRGPEELLVDERQRLHAKKLVGACLATMRPRHAEVLRRRLLDGDVLHDIARDMGISRERVRQIEKSALRMFRAELERRGVTQENYSDWLPLPDRDAA